MKNARVSTLALISLATIFTLFSNYVITNFFTSRVVSEDILFKVIPYHISFEYLSDILFLLGIYLFIAKYFIPEVKKRVSVVNIVSIFFIFRAILMMLTPLMRPSGIDLPSHGIFRDSMTQFGMFPSGHIGLLALFYLLIQGEKYRRLKEVYLYIVIFSAILMVISLGHYSIDVVGGIMLSYIIVKEYWNKEKLVKSESIHP